MAGYVLCFCFLFIYYLLFLAIPNYLEIYLNYLCQLSRVGRTMAV